jgi:hypothetical protein
MPKYIIKRTNMQLETMKERELQNEVARLGTLLRMKKATIEDVRRYEASKSTLQEIKCARILFVRENAKLTDGGCVKKP